MLPKTNRLTVPQFWRSSNKYIKKNLAWADIFIKHNDINTFRAVVFVSRSINKHSTTRNKIRRSIIELLREFIKKKIPIDVLVRPKKIIITQKHREIKKDLEKHLIR